MTTVFHLELRQFPHVARAFNLSREELDRRFARPWVSGTVVQYEDRSWAPEKSKLIILEGPELKPGEMGLGRGWANVGRTSQEVTETILAEAQRGAEGRSTVELFKATLRGAARTAIDFSQVMALTAGEAPGWRVSQRVALAEQAIWELLHQRRLTLSDEDGPLETERWSAALLDWNTWAAAAGAEALTDGSDGPRLWLEAAG